MKCPRCQKEVNEENQYCPYCGQRLSHPRKDPALEQIKEIRRSVFTTIINRIMNIATFAAVVFCIAGMFGPAISYSGGSSNLEIGGLYWFSYEGWVMLQDGQLAIGPFITTFILYILTFAGVAVLGSLAITKAINSLRKREGCRNIPHIIGLSLIYKVYSAFISNFYYEYIHDQTYYYETGSGWGETLYGVAIPLFTIALIAYLIARAVFTNKPKVIVSTIFAVLSSFLALNSIGFSFALLGFQDFDLGEQVVFGTLHYFDAASGVPGNVAAFIIIMFILGLLLMGTVIPLAIINLRNMVKDNKINRPLFLAFAIASASIAILMLAVDIIFAAVVNDIPGFSNNFVYLSSNLISLVLITQTILGFSIATFILKDEPVDNNIIDQEVVSKDA